MDPGTRITGFGIIQHNKQKHTLLKYGTIHTKANDEAPARYLKIYNELKQLVEEFTPDSISIETQFVYKNVQSALKVGMARGIVLLLAAQHQIPIFEYAPKKAKLAVVGSGSASKEQVLKMIRMLLNIPSISSLDAADALALAICHAHYNRRIYV